MFPGCCPPRQQWALEEMKHILKISLWVYLLFVDFICILMATNRLACDCTCVFGFLDPSISESFFSLKTVQRFLFCFVLFCFVLFCFVLFCFVFVCVKTLYISSPC